ncbi:MAG TPA: DUF5685 family protein [Blastocatellia bacterium]|nr:DUF5685 family protein [Blastocatellia bacterium]
MFGLMKARVCSAAAGLKLQRRLHYCGTCKTMGRLYGQRSRLFLNHDAVFLGELLSAISETMLDSALPNLEGVFTSTDDWSRSYYSYNCLALPEKRDIPAVLQYAASAAVMMADFKVADKIQDSRLRRWTLVQRLFSTSFRTASRTLSGWGFPVDELRSYSKVQDQRESEAASATRAAASPAKLLQCLAEPTAKASALFFQHGAGLIGAQTAREVMYELGYSFGSIVYLLDAIEDYEKDFSNGEFNALRAAYHLGDATLPGYHRHLLSARLMTLTDDVESILARLPISNQWRQIFSNRLRSNLSARLGRQLPVCTSTGSSACASHESGGVRSRWASATEFGEKIASNRLGAAPSAGDRIMSRVSLVFAVVIGFVAPHQTEGVTSFHECLELFLNLIFLGNLSRSVFRIIPVHSFSYPAPPGGRPPGGPTVPPPGHPPGMPPVPPEQYLPPAGSPGGTPPGKVKKTCGCCCDCCDWGECCCECGECCDCS